MRRDFKVRETVLYSCDEPRSQVMVRCVGDRLLIYGATGYTGKLLAREARQLGLDPVLCARDERKVRALAAELQLAWRCTHLDDPAALALALSDVGVVLNAAGPFGQTSQPLLDACLRGAIHYLDVAGEIDSIERTAQRHAEARARGVMLMPGVGFDVVPSDCLALHVTQRVDQPRGLFIAISGQTLLSRGSARTMIDQLGDPVVVRRGGALCTVPPASIERRFDFGAGPRSGIAVSWGDVSSAYYTTGVSEITSYFEATAAVRIHNTLLRMYGWSVPFTPWQNLLQASTQFMPEGPNAFERARHRAVIVAQVEDRAGHVTTSRLHTPEAYSFTALSGAAIARRVLAGDWQAGFETPARVYGADFVLGFGGVTREDVS
jgi:short subunit dehydrogenase-like uncharacterized protein